MGAWKNFFIFPISGDFCAKIAFFCSFLFVANAKTREKTEQQKGKLEHMTSIRPHLTPKNKSTSPTPPRPTLTTRSHSVQSLSLFKLIQEDGLHKCQIQARKFKICVARCINLNPS